MNTRTSIYHVNPYQFVVRTSTRRFGSCDRNTEIDQQHVSTSNFPICSYDQQHILQNNWTFYRLHPHDSWIFVVLLPMTGRSGLSYSFFRILRRLVFLPCLIYLQPKGRWLGVDPYQDNQHSLSSKFVLTFLCCPSLW